MAEWSTVTFGALGEIFDGPHATPARVTEGAYFLNIASLQNGRLVLSASDHVADEDFARWTRRVTPRAEDLLFSYETRLGEAALMPSGVRACLGRRMALLRPDRDVVEPKFLLYLYLSKHVQDLIERNTIHGATVNRIPLSAMGHWAVSIPPLAAQRTMAQFLGALDEKTAANRGLAATAEQVIIGIAASAEGDLELGHAIQNPRATIDPESLGDQPVSLYSLPAFDAGRGPERVQAASIKSAKWLLSRPCVLVSKLNPRFPRIWAVDEIGPEPVLASTEFVVLEPKTVSPSVLRALLLQPSFSSALEARVAGTSGSHQRVRPADMLAVEIADPSTLPERAHAQIDALAARTRSAAKENAILTELRDTLLPALMSGRLRVRDAERAIEAVV